MGPLTGTHLCICTAHVAVRQDQSEISLHFDGGHAPTSQRCCHVLPEVHLGDARRPQEGHYQRYSDSATSLSSKEQDDVTLPWYHYEAKCKEFTRQSDIITTTMPLN